MSGITLGLRGIETVRTRLTSVALARIGKAVGAALVQSAILIEGRAKRRAPVRTGRLRASLTHGSIETPQAGRLQVRVGTNVTYAAFVEFGTGHRGSAGAPTPSAREGMAALGYHHGPSPGRRAQPYLFPAFEESRTEIVQTLETAVRTETARP